MSTRRMLSVTAPAYDERDNLTTLHQQLTAALAPLPYDYEIVIVDNGSRDGTLELLRELARQDPHLRYVSLTRNFGHQGGLLAGLMNARGDAVITMDADLQHPPEFIPQLVAAWEAGSQIVNSVKIDPPTGAARRLLDRAFYRSMDRLANLQLGQSDFRLLDRAVVDQLARLPESQKFLRGLISWLGYRHTTLAYQPRPRHQGRSKFRSTHLIEFALRGLTAFSIAPLRLLMRMGFLFFVPSCLYLIWLLIAGLISLFGDGSYQLPPGWATLAVTVVFFGAIQLLAVGILGEYIGRIYFETKRRPEFIVQELSPPATPAAPEP